MKIAILDDYQDQVRQLECFAALAPFEVTVFHHTETDEAILASTLAEFDALVLIRERTAITASLLAKLPNLKLSLAKQGKSAIIWIFTRAIMPTLRWQKA